jgi:hypothetical protein
MLTESQFNALIEPIIELYEEFNQSVINDIARRLSKLPMTATAAWQAQRLNEAGMLYNAIVERLSKLTGKSDAELRRLFARAGVQSTAFDSAIYTEAGLSPIPLNLSPAMVGVLSAGLQKTGNVINNMTMTTAIDAQQQFIAAADLAYMQVTTGTFSYDEAIKRGVRNVASRGVSVISYASGRKDQLDVAMRRTVLTGVAQTTAELQLTQAREMGVDLLQMSAHAGARPTHQVWQGKIFSISGTSKKYPPFVESTGYGTVTGYASFNCRHSSYPFFEGISEKAYSQSELNNLSNKKVTLGGKEIGQYEASQIQRGIERKIRYWKRQAEAMKSAGINNTPELEAVREYQAQMREFVKQTGLNRQRIREQI